MRELQAQFESQFFIYLWKTETIQVKKIRSAISMAISFIRSINYTCQNPTLNGDSVVPISQVRTAIMSIMLKVRSIPYNVHNKFPQNQSISVCNTDICE